MKIKSLLLHTCCAPCFSYVYELLKSSNNIISYFYNPNIAPKSEYLKRLEELNRFSNKWDYELFIGEYDIKKWTASVKPYRFSGERSERCWKCYRIRLEETFNFARINGIQKVGTVLSISPYKDTRFINSIGKELEQKYGIEFLEANFKKEDGYKKSVNLSKRHGLYRQDYCGCIYSRMERDRNSLWYKKYLTQAKGSP